MIETEKTAEPLSAGDGPDADVFLFVRGWEQQDIVFSLVVSFRVKVRNEFGDGTPKRAFAKEDQFPQAFLLDRA